MLFSLNWLKEYVSLPRNLTAKKLAEDLTMTTCEVEGIEDWAEKFEKMVVGKIAAIKEHPNADKLKIVMTDLGKKEPVQIVCGGTNLKEGMLVAVALPGAKPRWHGEGEPVTMEKAKIRGVESWGMICAANEIGLTEMFPGSDKEIIDLSEIKKIKPGQNLAPAFGLEDIILEIDNKSITNRPDLWNHYGLARELAVIYNTKLKKVNSFCHAELVSASKKRSRNEFGMTIAIEDKDLCPRYIGCLIKNVKIKPSPEWLQRRLAAVGLRPINNIVDITNYVMLDVGEPMHAFDKSKVIEIIIRKAKSGEKIMSLDGVERKLNNSMLVIADAKKPIAIAGVMGGAASGVDETTTEIIFEAANFNALSVRKTAQQLGLRTEASNRFEKNLDHNLTALAMRRAIELVKKFCPQAKVVDWIDVDYTKEKKLVIEVAHDFLEKRIGQKLNPREVVKILEKLGFIVETRRGASLQGVVYIVVVPSWRATGDISQPEDIVEEVARVLGYDNLAEHEEIVDFKQAVYQPEQELEKKIKNYLSLSCGLNEVFNYPWTEQRLLKKYGLNGKIIEISNPPAEENKWLAASLIPNLLKNIEANLPYFSTFKIFEIGRVFLSAKVPHFKPGSRHSGPAAYLADQPKMLAGAVVGKEEAFLTAKGILTGIAGIETKIGVVPGEFLGEKKLVVVCKGEIIGWLGEMKEKIKNKNIVLFEINFDKLMEIVGTGLDLSVKYAPLPQFPVVERDLAFEVGWPVKWEDLSNVILRSVATKDPVFKGIEFLSEFDLGDRKSVAFRIIYGADRTLKDEEVEEVQNKIIKLMEEKFGARLRVALGK